MFLHVQIGQSSINRRLCRQVKTILSTTARRLFLPGIHSQARGSSAPPSTNFTLLAKCGGTLASRFRILSMRKSEEPRKFAELKKDARLTIRIPKELKNRIDRIEQVYGVALPKIANECLTAFCEYVKQNEQTPTFPILISPTHAATESQLKLSADNLPLSTNSK